MEHLWKILKILAYLLLKFELISSMKVKKASKKIGEKLLENWRRMTKQWKKLVKG